MYFNIFEYKFKNVWNLPGRADKLKCILMLYVPV